MSESVPARVASVISGAVFAVCLPLLLIAGNVIYVTNSDWLYSYGWWRNEVPDRTGLSVSQLDGIADEIKGYFNNNEDLLDVRVNSSQGEIEVFTEREVLHMIDVKDLMRVVAQSTLWTGLGMLMAVIVGVVVRRRDVFNAISSWIRWSALIWGVAVGALVVASLINFGWVFTQFHLLSFANDLWLLDPYRDYLLLLFPERFFLEATLFVAVLAVIEFLGAYVAARLMEIRFGAGGEYRALGRSG